MESRPRTNNNNNNDEKTETAATEQTEEIPLRYGCADFWTWNPHDRSPEVKLYGAKHRTAYFHPDWSSGTAGVRGTRILNNGRYFWELKVGKRVFGTSIMFGIGTKAARVHADAFINLLGEDCNSWALSHKGLLWHGSRWFQYTKPFRENEATKIGILFDGIAGTLTYYKDGRCLGVAFRGLQEVKEPLYPIICSTAAKAQMTLSVMRRDFVSLQDRCRSLIIKLIANKKHELQKLMIPTRIRYYLEEAISDCPTPFTPCDTVCVGSL